MTFIQNTPESLLKRTDSLDPDRTCRGITTAGLPCRRALPTTPPLPKTGTGEGSFCWQHKAQSATSTPVKAKKGIRRGDSMDTLAERLGIVSLEGRAGREGRNAGRKAGGGGGRKKADRAKAGSGGGTLSCCFCFSVPIEKVAPAPRPQARPTQRPEKTASVPPPGRPAAVATAGSKPHSSPGRLGHPRPQQQSSPSSGPKRKPPRRSGAGGYLELIRPDTDPLTASLLLAELAKGYVESEEPGYIYMFWMTPPSRQRAPPGDAARALLGSGSGKRGRESEVVGSYNAAEGKRWGSTMLLKIGRASNVQRRMNEWARQCGYEIEVLRFYPYVPSSHSTAPAGGGVAAPGPRVTPHVKKVERLVHLELAGMGMKAAMGACEVCGREHREWFEVEGTRRGVGKVDEVIRRWVEWDEGVGV